MVQGTISHFNLGLDWSFMVPHLNIQFDWAVPLHQSKLK